jgi:general secretion pathway protein F
VRFEVTALKGGQGVVRLAVDATDESAARDHARAQGLTVLAARAARRGALPDLRRLFAPAFPVGLVSQELLALLSAGLSLPETLETLAEKESRPEHRRVFERLRDALFEGHPFSRALERFPEHFPPLYVATVRASERTGDLPEALARYIDYQARVDLVRKKVVSASIYPAVLIVVGGLVTLFLLAYVVPRFSGIYAESNRELPWLSQLLLQWGQLLNAHGTAVLAAVVAAVAALVLSAGGVRRVAFALAARIPAVAERMLVYQLARFYRTVGMLLTGGTPLPQALGMVSGLLSPALGERLAAATRRIREGTSVSTAMEACGLATPVAIRMLRVGERGGNLAEMMERIAVFHDDEIARWIDWFTKLFEPLLMAAIGIVIGVVVVLMYLPIFELAGSLQ